MGVKTVYDVSCDTPNCTSLSVHGHNNEPKNSVIGRAFAAGYGQYIKDNQYVILCGRCSQSLKDKVRRITKD